MKTMHQDSMLKVKMGLTTMEEALANVPADMIAMDGGSEAAEPKAKKHGH
jgi:type IV pilus assembly protein PilB